MKRPALFLLAAASSGHQSHDLVLYGGTAAGVMTAVPGARQGLKTWSRGTMWAAW